MWKILYVTEATSHWRWEARVTPSFVLLVVQHGFPSIVYSPAQRWCCSWMWDVRMCRWWRQTGRSVSPSKCYPVQPQVKEPAASSTLAGCTLTLKIPPMPTGHHCTVGSAAILETLWLRHSPHSLSKSLRLLCVPFFLLPSRHHLPEVTAHLLPDISHRVTGVRVTR